MFIICIQLLYIKLCVCVQYSMTRIIKIMYIYIYLRTIIHAVLSNTLLETEARYNIGSISDTVQMAGTLLKSFPCSETPTRSATFNNAASKGKEESQQRMDFVMLFIQIKEIHLNSLALFQVFLCRPDNGPREHLRVSNCGHDCSCHSYHGISLTFCVRQSNSIPAKYLNWPINCRPIHKKKDKTAEDGFYFIKK